MFYARADKSVHRDFLKTLLFFTLLCIVFFIWNSHAHGATEPAFTWTIDVIYPVQADTKAVSTAEKTRNAMFSELMNSLSAGGLQTSVEKFRSSKGDIYRLKSLTKTSLADFRRHLYSVIAKKIRLTSGPARVSISGRVNPAQALTIYIDSNPSTGYHWALDSSSGAKVVFEKTLFERRSFKYGAAEIQILLFKSNQEGSATVDIAYRRPWRKQDEEKIHLKLETADQLPLSLDISNPYAVKETAPTESISNQSRKTTLGSDDASALPTSLDWRTYGVVPDVRNQGGCGSCFAFGTVGIMESALKISGWPMTDLSEQFLVSCNDDGWNCDEGGLTAHKYHYDTLGQNQTVIGAVLETDMPYTESDGTCTIAYNHPYILSGWVFVPGDEWTVPTVNQIKNAINTYGPITAGVCAGDAFDAYESGVFSTDENCGGSTNHQIILVGWNDNNGANVDGYWILRNSWGSDWGESGYMKIKYGTSRVGEGTSYVTVASCDNDPVYNIDRSLYYDSIQTAYTGAYTGQTLLMKEETFIEDISMSRSIAVTLRGGYDCYYSSNSGFTTISGSMTIGGSNSVTVDQLIIK
jgi:C1A family cysteine protease